VAHARLTAYVAYQSPALSERDVLIAALTDLYRQVEPSQLKCSLGTRSWSWTTAAAS
jgi:hypothetical protein